jgi:putative FmdB family regulatory protein
MPTYDYRCRDCSHEFEIQQSFSDDALTECPQCGGSLRKVFGNVAISFKGSGFYKTDSRNGAGSGGSKGSNGSKDSSTESSSDSSGSSSGDSSSSASPKGESSTKKDAAPASTTSAA